MPRKFYKVTGPNGEAISGGVGFWPLPKDGQPGDWLEVQGPLVPCFHGLHVTDRPSIWFRSRARVFEVEITGEPVYIQFGKWMVQRARLLREVIAPQELMNLGFFVIIASTPRTMVVVINR